jgi:hypothetical protein
MFRLWVNVGLRGHGADGLVSPGWVGRTEDRNTAYADLLFCSGLRLTKAASLLTIELPRMSQDGGKYYPARLAPKATKSQKARTFYVSATVLGGIESYVQTGRAAGAAPESLPSGYPADTPQEALDCVCGLYLNDPTAWHQQPR